ncbi:Methyltransferase-like protein 17 [Mactra antiquata]
MYYRFIKESTVVSPPKYIRDKEGYIVTVNNEAFPDSIDIDPVVNDRCEEDPLRYPKHHAGLMFSEKATFLPEKMVTNARQILSENDLICNTSFATDVTRFHEIVLRRQPPLDKSFIQERKQIIAKQLLEEKLAKSSGKLDELNEEKQKKILDGVTKVAEKIFNKTHHNWKEIKYSKRMVYVYMAARLTQNYSVLEQIFKEMQILDEGFQPYAILNVGSGLGTAVWAANRIWGKDIYEYYNVDTSSEMNNLAKKILATDNLNPNDLYINGVFFRQHVPSPQHVQNRFPLVVSAYLLMDLPSALDRINMIADLWELTENYLVLVEYGTTAGYRLIQEAKQFILQMKEEDPTFEGHVFSPCTHDALCPKLEFKKSPCTFSLKYRQLNIDKEYGQGDTINKERFSYVVLKKGPRKEKDIYPRLTEVHQKSGHSRCYMCCPDGTMRHFIFSKSRPSRNLYRCVRRCQAGDLIPIIWPHVKSADILPENRTYLNSREVTHLETASMNSRETTPSDFTEINLGETIDESSSESENISGDKIDFKHEESEKIK